MLDKSFAIALLLALLSSCGNDSGFNNSTVELLATKRIKLPLDKKTSYNTLSIQLFNDKETGKELLSYFNKQSATVLYYDINESKLIKEVPLVSDGPNGVTRPSSSYTISFDSIFIFSPTMYQVTLVNDKSTVLRKYRILEGEHYNENTGLIYPNTPSPAKYFKGKLYLSVIPDRNPYKENFFEGHTNSVLDIKTGEYMYYNFFPNELRSKVWGVRSMTHSETYNLNGEFVTSFPPSDSIYVWTPGSKRQSFLAKSRFKEHALRPFTNPDESRDLSDYALKSAYYESIVYDQYRDVYYRIVCLPVDTKNDLGETNDIFSKPISIMVLDGKFNVLGEKLIENNSYLFHMFFVAKDGLYISNSNPHNKDLEEDYVEFTCFSLKNI